jgi:tRNA nucleotidyltransferase/poly(A) polymerase
MKSFTLLNFVPVFEATTLEEAKNLLFREAKTCLGIKNSLGKLIGYVLKEDLLKALKFLPKGLPVKIITILTKTLNFYSDIEDFEVSSATALVRGIFVKEEFYFSQKEILLKQNIDLREKYEKNIHSSIKKALTFCVEAANEKKISIYIIGGIVRDIILDKKNFDIDVTVKGNAIEFAKFLEEKYKNICIIKKIHQDFKTVKVIFDINSEKVEIDLASTRKESYPYPASLPHLEEIGCSLLEDVLRRDFSINSMALILNKERFKFLEDYLGGYRDLNTQLLEILHPLSFIDDPTRIIRGLKFSARLNYKLSEASKYLQDSCLESGLFNNLAGERIKLELKQTLNLNQPKILERFLKEKIYVLVDDSISEPENTFKIANNCFKAINHQENFPEQNIWIIYFGSVLMSLSLEKIKNISARLYFCNRETSILTCAKKLFENRNTFKEKISRFEVYEFFEKSPLESIIILLACDETLKPYIHLYLKELKHIKIQSTGEILLNLGFKQGPEIGNILREILKAKINKEITANEQEMDFIKKLQNIQS